MQESTIMRDQSADLDIFGQQPSLNIYTQICFCFRVADPSINPKIIEILTFGLERLSASFPWLKGEVVNEAPSDNDSGIFKIQTSEKVSQLVVKDLTSDPSTPSMDAMRQSNFPFSMLDEDIIAPRRTLPTADELNSGSTPVFLLQATFIIGGLLLTFVGQHQTMDMTGQGQIIHLLSKACREEAFSSEEISSGNLIRHNLIPLLDESYKECSQLVYQIVRPTPSHSISKTTEGLTTSSTPPKCCWKYFTFSPLSLATLKSLASESISPSSGYISTDDALSAIVWQSVVRARLPRLSLAAESTLARAVDVRSYLGISQTYPGLFQNMTYHTYTTQKLVKEPLGRVSSRLRSALDPSTSSLAYDTRALATFLSRAPHKDVVSFTATIDLSTDIMLSSWAKLDCHELDFGLGLGKPEAVRRPQFEPVESLIYLMPRALDGEIAVAICLRDEDMERLRCDADFTKYGEYID